MNASGIGAPCRFLGTGQNASAGNSIAFPAPSRDAGGMERHLLDQDAADDGLSCPALAAAPPASLPTAASTIRHHL
jgi:hypothetical protein